MFFQCSRSGKCDSGLSIFAILLPELNIKKYNRSCYSLQNSRNYEIWPPQSSKNHRIWKVSYRNWLTVFIPPVCAQSSFDHNFCCIRKVSEWRWPRKKIWWKILSEHDFRAIFVGDPWFWDIFHCFSIVKYKGFSFRPYGVLAEQRIRTFLGKK